MLLCFPFFFILPWLVLGHGLTQPMLAMLHALLRVGPGLAADAASIDPRWARPCAADAHDAASIIPS